MIRTVTQENRFERQTGTSWSITQCQVYASTSTQVKWKNATGYIAVVILKYTRQNNRVKIWTTLKVYAAMLKKLRDRQSYSAKGSHARQMVANLSIVAFNVQNLTITASAHEPQAKTFRLPASTALLSAILSIIP